MTVEQQAVVLYAGVRGYLDNDRQSASIGEFERSMLSRDARPASRPSWTASAPTSDIKPETSRPS